MGKTIERMIADAVNDEAMERIVVDCVEKSVRDAIDAALGWNSASRKAITERIDAVMAKAIERHDFKGYAVKLEDALTEIVNRTALRDNAALLENFKGLMAEPDKGSVTVTELFEAYCAHVADNVDTSELEVCTDDDPSYEAVTARVELIDDDRLRCGSLLRSAVLAFSCEEDEGMAVSVPISSFGNEGVWRIRYEGFRVSDLKRLSKFDVLLARLSRADAKLVADVSSMTDLVDPTAQPECDWR